jgi:hypothetical protein
MISDDLIWAQDYLLVTSNDQIVPDCKPGIDKGYMIKSTATRTGVVVLCSDRSTEEDSRDGSLCRN